MRKQYPMTRIQVIFLLSLATYLFLACGQQKQEKENRTAFRYNQHNPITSLDPAFARTQNNIWAVDCLFNGLVQLDEHLLVQPCLAKSWSISPDGLTYRFLLRQDVFFHDDPAFAPDGKGRKMVASDVVYSFERLLDESWPKPGSWIFKGRVAADSAFTAENDSIFVLRLSSSFQPMLQILTMQYASIVPHEVCAYWGREFRRHPVGTGPFRFKVWAENQALVMLKNERYFEKDSSGTPLPYLDAIRVSFITDRKTAFLEFKKGRLDYFFGLESAYIHELLTQDGTLQPELAGEIQFTKNPYLNTEYLGMKMSDLDNTGATINPLQFKKIRQALNYGLDRAQMLRVLRNQVGKPADAGFAPRGLPSYAPNEVKGYSYRPDKAAALLAEAGFPKGKNLPVITLLCNNEYLDICTFITRQWEDLGVQVRIELQETALLRERMRNGQAPFFRASWIADYPDAESFLTCFYSKNGTPPNYTQFKNPLFDQYYEAALAETDQANRFKLYRQMDQILIEEAPVVFLFYDETAQFTRRNISGLPGNAINLLSLKRVKKSN
ncbi:MAG TPA: ABC transporter substrate-binding protein [Saprospiraceae bacterium]|nr:ABC transporter substrate-binding protein [Saprospiraceae bacterium]